MSHPLHMGKTHNKPRQALLYPTTSNLHPKHCSSTICSLNPIMTSPTNNRQHIVCIQHKVKLVKPCYQKQLCTLPSTVISGIPSQSPARQGNTSDLMQHPHSDLPQTKSTLQYPMIATINNITDDMLLAYHENQPTSTTTLTSSMTNQCYSIGNTTFQQQPEIKGTHPPEEPSMSPFSATNIAATNMQHNPMLYSRAYRYKNFCSTHGNLMKPGSIWHYQIPNPAKEDSLFTKNP